MKLTSKVFFKPQRFLAALQTKGREDKSSAEQGVFVVVFVGWKHINYIHQIAVDKVKLM